MKSILLAVVMAALAGCQTDPAASPPAAPTPSASASAPAGDDQVYAASLESAGRYVVGQPGTVEAVLVAKAGYHCNDKYPYKFKLDAPPEGVTYGSDTVKGANIGAARTVLSVPFTPSTAGQKTISGTFYFSVCNEDTCKIDKRPLSMTINVDQS